MSDSAAEYIASRPPGERRQRGEVYTPSDFAEFVLRRAQYSSASGPLLDPSAGCGAFLLAAQRIRIEEALRGGRAATPAGISALRKDLEATLFGVDISVQACAIASRLLREDFAERFGKACAVDYRPSIEVADFLEIAAGVAPRPAQWPGEGFAMIAGNPPYVQLPRLTSIQRAAFKSNFSTASGRFDLYSLFIEAASRMMAPAKATLAFIVPNRLLSTVASRSARELLQSSLYVREIIDLHEARVFPGVDAYPLVVVAERTKAVEVEVLRVQGSPRELLSSLEAALTQRTTSVSMQRFRVSAEQLRGREWVLLPPKQKQTHARLLSGCLRVSDLVARWGIGSATGRDAIFTLEREEAKFLDQNLLRKTIRGRDVRPFKIRDPEKWLLFPYEVSSEHPRKAVNLEKYPRTQHYLLHHRPELEQRTCVTRTANARSWYEFHEIPDPTLAAEEKVVWPDVSAENAFAVDRGQYHPLHSCYYAIAESDPGFLCGLLNSLPLRYYFQTTLPRISGGHFRFQKRFVADAPAPACDPDTQNEIAKAAAKGDLETIDVLVSGAFGLHDEDVTAMKRVLAE